MLYVHLPDHVGSCADGVRQASHPNLFLIKYNFPGAQYSIPHQATQLVLQIFSSLACSLLPDSRVALKLTTSQVAILSKQALCKDRQNASIQISLTMHFCSFNTRGPSPSSQLAVIPDHSSCISVYMLLLQPSCCASSCLMRSGKMRLH